MSAGAGQDSQGCAAQRTGRDRGSRAPQVPIGHRLTVARDGLSGFASADTVEKSRQKCPGFVGAEALHHEGLVIELFESRNDVSCSDSAPLRPLRPVCRLRVAPRARACQRVMNTRLFVHTWRCPPESRASGAGRHPVRRGPAASADAAQPRRPVALRLRREDFALVGYERHPATRVPIAVRSDCLTSSTKLKS